MQLNCDVCEHFMATARVAPKKDPKIVGDHRGVLVLGAPIRGIPCTTKLIQLPIFLCILLRPRHSGGTRAGPVREYEYPAPFKPALPVPGAGHTTVLPEG